MRLVFTNADEDVFEEYQERFLREVLEWARKRGTAVSEPVLAAVLDYKYGEPADGGNGLLARWTAADVARLLLNWMPHRETLSEDDIEQTPASLRAWWDFLAERDWLDERSDSVEELAQAADEVDVAYRDAMDDPITHDIAMYMQLVMAAHGVDTTDSDAVEEFEAKTDSGEIEVDAETLSAIAQGEEEDPPSLLEGPGRLGYCLPAPALPGKAERAAAIEATAVLPDLRAADGDPSADPEELAWQYFEETPERLPRLLGDYGEFEDVFGADPEEAFQAVLTALCHGREEGIAVSAVASILAADVDEHGHLVPPADLERFTELATCVLSMLTDLAAVTLEPQELDTEGAEDERKAVFTPLGWWLWFELLTADGLELRTFEELMAEDAEVLVDRACAEASGEAELEQWIAARGTEEAMRGLVAVYRRTDDCVHRSIIRSVTADHPLQARPFFEQLRDDPRLGSRARTWLWDTGFLKEEELGDTDLFDPLLDGLSASLRMGFTDDEDMLENLPALGQDFLVVFDMCAETRHPECEFVLTWFGGNHPDPEIREAARKALHSHESRFQG